MKQRLPISIRLALIASLATALFLSLVGTGLYLRTKSSLDGGIDASLRARAADLRHSLLESTSAPRLSGSTTTFEQLIAPGGRVVAGADQPPLLSDAERRAAQVGPIYRWRGEQARLLALPAPNGSVLVVGTGIASRERALESLATALIVGIPIAGLLAALAAYLVARRALVPVQRLQRRAAELALSEKPEGLAIPESRDEVEDLARTLDEMLQRLAKAREHEREFVANASHQLRTPIAIIEAELELALSDPDAAVYELRSALASAHEETLRLGVLARRLLQLSLAEDGALPLDLEQTDVMPLAKATTRRFAARAARDHRAVLFAGGTGIVSCDRERMADVLDALVDNALVHGEGEIRLGVEADGDWVRICVADQGHGFPAGSEDDALGRFVTFGSNSSHTGLGLSIADAVTRAHGGRLEIHRRDSRTVIEVVLPRCETYSR